jgi:perosamine synthetase
MNIPLSAPDIGEREIEYVNSVLASSQLSMGPWLDKFEKQFASFIGTEHAIAVNSGTSGLHLCVRAMEIGSHDAVITSSFSFVASVSCFLYEGAIPILVDIDPKTLNLDPEAVREYLRNQCTRSENGRVIDLRSGRVVKAIMPVHIFGLPCRMDELMKIAGEYGLSVIEDACEAIGATFDGQRAGTFGNAGVFAFYPNKQMTTGEGGMITTKHAQPGARHGRRLVAARTHRLQLPSQRIARSSRSGSTGTHRQYSGIPRGRGAALFEPPFQTAATAIA